ncbi:MAG: TolC family protein [Bryobacterales bacterium]|nr:TolC family protein [Bryobacterales bacterium]
MRVTLACTLFLGALSLFGQQALVEAPRFPQSSYFEQVLNPRVPRVELRDPVRLHEFVVNGKLELSLKNYVELVLANNTDIEIQRLAVEIPKNQTLRAAGIFDPQFQGRFAATRSNSQTIDVLAGAATLSQLNQPWNFNYVQTLSTGTQIQAGFNGAKLSTNNQFQTFNPSFTTNMALSFTQPLLRGRGSEITKLPVSIARSRVRQTQYNVQDQILRLLVQAETTYWNVIEARENLRVQEQALALNDAALKRAQRELELGATSPLEIFQPQAQYANAEIFVTQARYRLAQVEDGLRRQIAADLDPEIRRLPIVLTEPVTAPPNGDEIDKESTVQKAMNLRPDLKAAMQLLDIDELNLKGARNGLLPQLALGGGYTSTGRGGVFFPRTNFGGVQQVLAPVPGGLGDAFNQLFNFGFPIYNFSLTLNLPLRDRRAAADYADANIQRKRDMLQLRTTEQQIRLEVLNAINQVELSKASLKLAQIARDLAQKRVEAEQKKYELGTTVIFFVLAAQSDLTTAEAALVTQTVGYRRNLLTLLQRTGELLQERGVVLP